MDGNLLTRRRLVAATVTLASGAAVASSFVLGLSGDEEYWAEDSTFGWEYSAPVNTEFGDLTITHTGGPPVPLRLYIRGNGLATDDVRWTDNGGDVTGEREAGDSAVQNGDSVTVAAAADYQLALVYTPPEGESTTLSADTGPAFGDTPGSETDSRTNHTGS